MKIEKGIISGENIEYRKSINQSERKEKIDTIILHNTVSSSTNGTANWLCDTKAKASYHFIIGKEGKIIQLVDCDKKAWHCGKSTHPLDNKPDVNPRSIGVGFINWNWLDEEELTIIGDKEATYKGKKIEYKLIKEKHKEFGDKLYWDCYNEIQIQSGEKLIKELIKEYDIKYIYGHYKISPNRKSDTGPIFPMLKFQKLLIK